MLRRAVLVAAIAVVPFTAAACGGGGGGGGSGLFDVANIAVMFDYDADLFDISTTFSFATQSGAPPAARAGVALDANNAIIVSRYDLRITVTKENLAQVKDEVDEVIGSLADEPVSGREVEYGGLPGYEYAIDLDRPPNGQSRMAVLFDGNVEYLINCQSTPERRDVLEGACREALDTLTHK